MAYYFKLPAITELTIGQQAALNDPNAIAISGGPGTGKSVVSLWRHIRNYGTGSKKSLLLTYTKTLEAYLISSAASESKKADNESERKRINESSLHVNRTYNWLSKLKKHYEEIIVDEAQDVHLSNYKVLKNYSNEVSYSADTEQSVYLSREELREIELGLPKLFNNGHHYLDENYRNTVEIVQFVRSLFVNRRISHGNLNGPKPILINAKGDIEKQKKAIIEIINAYKSETHNIAILLPLKSHVDSYFHFISNSNIICSMYYDGKPFKGIENVHITTFKSSKGTEFDTVIIPGFHKMKEMIANNKVIEEEDYYVAFTRAKRNLYLLSLGKPTFMTRTSLNMCNIQNL